MESTAPVSAPVISEADFEAQYAAMAKLVSDALRDNEAHMASDRAEIERLKTETEAIASHTDIVLASLRKQIEQLRS